MHDDRSAIELAMARGAGKREAGKQFNVSEDAVWRHWQNHVPETIKIARRTEVLRPGARLEALVDEESVGLLDSLRVIRGGLLRQFDVALSIDNTGGVAMIARELHRNAELFAKATGELVPHTRKTIEHVVLSPQYLELRSELATVLRRHPDALRDVMGAFQRLESRASASMIEGTATPAGGGD
jgi:hypothetical protein